MAWCLVDVIEEGWGLDGDVGSPNFFWTFKAALDTEALNEYATVKYLGRQNCIFKMSSLQLLLGLF